MMPSEGATETFCAQTGAFMPGQAVPKSLSIRELPRSERPRERLKALGATALSSAELLAILVGSGCGGRSALTVGQDILVRADGSLRRLAAQPMAALTAYSGVGVVRAITIHAALELGRRMVLEAREEGDPLRSPRDVYAAFAPRLEDLPVEEFHVAILDAQHRLERDVTVTRGILNSSLVHPREVFREAIAGRAAAIVLFHNHPSGDPRPSADDMALTARLVDAGQVVGIDVLDHLILADQRYYSFMEAGQLPHRG